MNNQMQEQDKAQWRLRMQAWGAQELTQHCLKILTSRYPKQEPWDLAASWEEQHRRAGEQMVLRDLKKIIEQGSL